MASNETLQQIVELLNLNISDVTNTSVVNQEQLFDFYEAYKTREREQLLIYKFVAYVIGTLIILSNIVVVISSGLILRKGQQPKSTYLLLGNVSLADTIIGVSLIFGTVVDHTLSSNTLCIFQIGMIVCPTLVSIFSVGLIAIDRYIYILHGLYYQRWINTTRVRICIVFTWLIGLVLGFMPITGWTNKELQYERCFYMNLFPGGLILINAILSLIPIFIVAILYSMILIRAIANVNKIRNANKAIRISTRDLNKSIKPRFHIVRNKHKPLNNYYSVKISNNAKYDVKRSASFCNLNTKNLEDNIFYTAKSNEKLYRDSFNYSANNVAKSNATNKLENSISELSIWTVYSNINETSTSIPKEGHSKKQYSIFKKDKHVQKPNKWRAITIVMLTSGSFIVTWLPFFIFVIFYVLCVDKLHNKECFDIRGLLTGPLAALGFTNSFLNPLIYAWWHKGFKSSIKSYFRSKCFKRSESGTFVASLPAFGWTGRTFTNFRCWYIAVFPASLLIILSVIALAIIVMVCVLYFIILHRAVKTVDAIIAFKRSKLGAVYINKGFENDNEELEEIADAVVTIAVATEAVTKHHLDDMEFNEIVNTERRQWREELKRGIYTITSYCSKARAVHAHPSKLKAVKMVLLVTACFVGTWAPYYVSIILYVNCDILVHGYACVPLEILTLGPLYLLGVSNSLCDPIIYAWWHTGFKHTISRIYWKYVWNIKVLRQRWR